MHARMCVFARVTQKVKEGHLERDKYRHTGKQEEGKEEKQVGGKRNGVLLSYLNWLPPD